MSDLPDWPAHLAQEKFVLVQFNQLLDQEQQLLLTGQTALLMALADSKNQQSDALMAYAQQRRMHRFPVDPGPELARLRDELRELAQRAERTNRLNGELIAIRLRHNQQALTALRNAAQRATIYGPDGQAATDTAGRTILGEC